MNDINIKNSYVIDIGMSYYLYDKNADFYKYQECFNNAFKCMTCNFETKNKAVFGYVLSTDGKRKVAVRHAWNVINNTAIDVTMFADNEHPVSILNYRYIPANEYDSFSFLEAVEKNNGFPALPKTQKEYRIRKKLRDLGFELLE